MSKVLTENSFLELKVGLRLDHLPNKEKISVLDCYSGNGYIWGSVRKKTSKQIALVRLEKEAGRSGFYLKGENTKYMAAMDLSAYDVIDLDAFGVPFDQLEILFRQNYRGVVFVTFIQSGMGNLPRKMLGVLGYTPEMVKKCPTLFSRDGLSKLKRYLALRGVSSVSYYNIGRKTYLYFCTAQ